MKMRGELSSMDQREIKWIKQVQEGLDKWKQTKFKHLCIQYGKQTSKHFIQAWNQIHKMKIQMGQQQHHISLRKASHEDERRIVKYGPKRNQMNQANKQASSRRLRQVKIK